MHTHYSLRLLLPIAYLVACYAWSDINTQSRQIVVSEIINTTLIGNNISIPTPLAYSPLLWKNQSEVLEICSKHPDMDARVGCCQPSDTRVLTNVRVENGHFVLHSNEAQKPISLPGIKSLRLQKDLRFTTQAVPEKISPDKSKCVRMFEGTLHVIGKSTVNKVYHAIGDNYLPLVSQIVLDAVLDPAYLHQPRMLLTGFHPTQTKDVPHMGLITSMASAGTVTFKQAEGWCFSRVVWGHGAHVLYSDTRSRLRGLAADFSRAHVAAVYDMRLPPEFSPRINHVNVSTTGSTNGGNKRPFSTAGFGGNPLRVVLYSRGNKGSRTLNGENVILARLSDMGAETVLCCDFESTSLEQQIAFAYHADMVMGVHGAALVHSLFSRRGVITLEYKTVYAYESILFPIVTESRRGTHIQIDTRMYDQVRKGTGRVDKALVERTLRAVNSALEFIAKGNPSKIEKLGPHEDYIIGPMSVAGTQLDHILGPPRDSFDRLCTNTTLAAFRRILKSKNEHVHCSMCKTFRHRF